MQSHEIIEKLASVEANQRQFVPDGSTEPVDYFELVLGFTVQGQPHTLRTKLTQDKFTILQVADKSPKLQNEESK